MEFLLLLFKVLSWNFLDMSEENYERTHKNGLSSDQYISSVYVSWCGRMPYKIRGKHFLHCCAGGVKVYQCSLSHRLHIDVVEEKFHVYKHCLQIFILFIPVHVWIKWCVKISVYTHQFFVSLHLKEKQKTGACRRKLYRAICLRMLILRVYDVVMSKSCFLSKQRERRKGYYRTAAGTNDMIPFIRVILGHRPGTHCRC